MARCRLVSRTGSGLCRRETAAGSCRQRCFVEIYVAVAKPKRKIEADEASDVTVVAPNPHLAPPRWGSGSSSKIQLFWPPLVVPSLSDAEAVAASQ